MPESDEHARVPQGIDPELAAKIERQSRGAPSADPKKNPATFDDVCRAIRDLPKLGERLRRRPRVESNGANGDPG